MPITALSNPATVSPSPSATAEPAVGRVVVTGARGFIGSRAVERFARRNWQVLALPANDEPGGLSSASLAEELERFAPDLLIHAAGPSSVFGSMAAPLTDFRRSVETTAQVLEAIRLACPRCVFVFPSSGSVYGDPARLPTAEGAPLQPVSPYGHHKKICEMLCEEYRGVYGLRCLVLRLFSVYGEGLGRQVVHDLFRKFMAADGKTVGVFGTGDELRDFIHIDDVLEAIEALYRAGADCAVNVASGEALPIRELASAIRDRMGSVSAILFTGEHRAGDPLRMEADIGLLRSFGFTPRVPLSEGLERYRRWLCPAAADGTFHA